MKIRVIVNPSAAAGTAGKKIPELERLMAKHGVEASIVTTTSPGDATKLARDAADAGVDVLGVMGGDGTFNEVAQACLRPDGEAAFGPSLALIPAGTGGDLKRSLALTNDVEAAVQRMLASRRRPLDVGVITEQRPDAAPARAFFNVASMGLSAMVCDMANRGPKWIGGKLTFYGAALRATFAYRNLGVRVRVDGSILYEGPAYLVALANGQWFGGGMHIAPNAEASDGLLDVVVLGDYSKLGAVAGLSASIYAGTHIHRSKTVVGRGKVVELQPLGPNEAALLSVMETDGEVPRLRLPLQARLCPHAVNVCG